MKHILLTTTAFVALTGAAAAELTISGTGRIGFLNTEGNTAKDAVNTYGVIGAAAKATFEQFGLHGTDNTAQPHQYVIGTADITVGAVGSTATAGDITALDAMIVEATERLKGGNVATVFTDTTDNLSLIDTKAERTQIETDIASMQAIRAQLVQTTAAVVATSDTTTAANRFRISFAGSGETDGGIAYGISGRAEQSDTSNLGSQYISGAFGKVSMGDLNGADEVAAGGGVSNVGLTGLGDNGDFAFASKDHNVGYEFSTAGVKIAYSQDTSVTSGSNSAFGVSYSGDMGGATISVGLGTASVGSIKQDTMSASVSMGGLTVKAMSSTNDNGPDVEYAAGTARHADGSTTVYAADTQAVSNPDTDQTGVSIGYTMGAMTATAFMKTESQTGTVDKDYSGIGINYDMGGATLKIGVADADGQSLADFGLSFSF
jgi:outer membrane protein OmpU